MIEITKIDDSTIIRNKELLERVKMSKKNAYSEHYLVTQNACDIAFLSLDSKYTGSYLFLYELFVVTEKRRKGYASEILNWVLEFAKKQSFQTIRLEPHPFDRTIAADALAKFYKDQGFKAQPNTTQIVKNVANISISKPHLGLTIQI